MFELFIYKNPISFTDSHAPLLSLQTATGVKAWEAFCHHTKLNMEEEFQSNWLNQRGQDQILTNAFEEAREEDFQTLSDMRQKFEGKRLDWILSMTKYPKISEFIMTYNTVFNINFDKNGKFFWCS